MANTTAKVSVEKIAKYKVKLWRFVRQDKAVSAMDAIQDREITFNYRNCIMQDVNVVDYSYGQFRGSNRIINQWMIIVSIY